MSILPKIVSNLIKGDGEHLRRLYILAGFIGFITGVEMICLYLMGNILVGNQMPILIDSYIIAEFVSSYSETRLLVALGVIFVSVSLLRFIFQLNYFRSSLKWSALVSTRLSTEVMRAFLLTSTSEFDRLQSGEIIYGIMEAPLSGNQLVDGISTLITSLFTIALIGLALILISPWVLLGGLLMGIPTFLIVVTPLQKKLKILKNKLIHERSDLTLQATNMIGSIKDIKSLNSEIRMADLFAGRVNKTYKTYASTRLINLIPGPILQAFFQVAFGIIIILISSTLSGDNLVAYLPELGVAGYGLLRIYPAITSATKAWLIMQNALHDLLVCHKWIKMPFDRLAGGVELAPSYFQGLEFQDVSFKYDQGRPVVSNLNFTVEAGKMISIVGESGAGKSTLIDLILKFRTPEGGAVLLGKKNLDNISRHSWLQNVGVVKQEVFLFSGTIRENLLAWSPESSEENLISACRIAGLSNFIDRLPHQLDTVVGERGVTMSGGQRQRIAIARAILRNPQVLILDEALSALDGETESQVLQSLTEKSSKMAIIIISHRMASVVQSDNIIVLDQGCIVEQGTHAELLANNGKYCRLFKTQNYGS